MRRRKKTNRTERNKNGDEEAGREKERRPKIKEQRMAEGGKQLKKERKDKNEKEEEKKEKSVPARLLGGISEVTDINVCDFWPGLNGHVQRT